MPKTKRTTLPAVTEADIARDPKMLRRTPTGWAWKCYYCGKFASSKTVNGKYVCRDHGGSTLIQRDPVARGEARAQGKQVKRPPGRPMTTGLYSKDHHVRVDELVAEYQSQRLDPDHTDRDMLYLRAYLAEMTSLRPEMDELRAPLQELGHRLQLLLKEAVPSEDNVTVEAVVELLERGREWTAFVRTVQTLLNTVQKYTSDIEARHARLIALSKVRAETHLKNSAAHQLDVFELMCRRFMVVLQEQLSADDFAALQRRIARDLAELPQRALEGGVKV